MGEGRLKDVVYILTMSALFRVIINLECPWNLNKKLHLGNIDQPSKLLNINVDEMLGKFSLKISFFKKPHDISKK